MTADGTYRHSTRRNGSVLAPAPAQMIDREEQWPDWIVPAAVGSVMLSISAYHHAALLDLLLSVF